MYLGFVSKHSITWNNKGREVTVQAGWKVFFSKMELKLFVVTRMVLDWSFSTYNNNARSFFRTATYYVFILSQSISWVKPFVQFKEWLPNENWLRPAPNDLSSSGRQGLSVSWFDFVAVVTAAGWCRCVWCVVADSVPRLPFLPSSKQQQEQHVWI